MHPSVAMARVEHPVLVADASVFLWRGVGKCWFRSCIANQSGEDVPA